MRLSQVLYGEWAAVSSGGGLSAISYRLSGRGLTSKGGFRGDLDTLRPAPIADS